MSPLSPGGKLCGGEGQANGGREQSGGGGESAPLEKRKSETIICLLSLQSSSLSNENVPLYSSGLKHVEQRDISQTNPVMSISIREGAGGGGGGATGVGAIFLSD